MIGIGEAKAPVSLRNVCNRFILISNIVGEEKSVEKSGDRAQSEAATFKSQPPSKVVPLAIKAMISIDPEGEWYALGQLGQYMTRANPDFDPRTYGSAKLSDLLESSGRFEIRKSQGNQMQVRRVD